MMTSHLSKFLWAIDPFDVWPAQLGPMGSVLRDVTEGHDVAIHPLSFFSQEEAQWYDYAAKTGKMLQPEDFRTALEKSLADLHLPGLRETRLITEDRVTPSSFAGSVLSFAAMEKANAIAISTHGKRGPERWLDGSFAETLLLQSPMPVLVLNGQHFTGRRLGPILVPTDFHLISQAAFMTAVDLAAKRKVDVILFHERPRFSSGREKEMESWAQWAKEKGVKVEVWIDSSEEDPARAIVQYARRTAAGLILMGTEAGKVRAAFGGSCARAVVREADCPVLVWHPEVGEGS